MCPIQATRLAAADEGRAYVASHSDVYEMQARHTRPFSMNQRLGVGTWTKANRLLGRLTTNTKTGNLPLG